MYQNIFISHKTDYEEQTVYLWDDKNGLTMFPYDTFDYAYKKSPFGQYTSIYGDKLAKIDNPSYGQKGLFESDVPRETKVLTDMYLDEDIPSTGHRVLTIDIEVSSKGGFASPNTAENAIIGISCHDSETDVYTTFVLSPEEESSVTTNTAQNYKEEIVVLTEEETLLNVFLSYYTSRKFTIITGWNIDRYDIPYLYNRLKNIFDYREASKLSPVGHIKYNQNQEKFQIGGVSCLDYLPLYKKFTYTQQPSYRLDEIGKFEVGMGKVVYEGTLDDLYKNDRAKFIEYNLNDVKIVVAIDKKMKLIELVRAICHMGHVPYEDYKYSSRFIEGTILTYLHRKEIICANKPEGGREAMEAQDESDEKGFTGAFVKEPTPGRYDWVYSLDLESLYPSIIMSLNISPETKVGRVKNWNIDKHMRGEIETYEMEVNGGEHLIDKDKFKTELASMETTISSNGILYSTEKMGVIPEILTKWFADRKKFKNKMKEEIEKGNKEQAEFYDRRQHVQKILLNSIYGTLGLPIFRFYDLDNALAVTATGQDVIKNTAKFINQQYQTKTQEKKDFCIYIDTDSVYFSAVPLFHTKHSDIDKITTITIARNMEELANKFYDVMAKRVFNCKSHRFHIKGESVMSAAFWVAKKMYALKKVYDLETSQDTDKIVVKGLAVVRSQTPPAFRDLMKNILGEILMGSPKANIDKEILAFHDTLDSQPVEKIARNTAVKEISKYENKNDTIFNEYPKGTPAHVKAAMAYNRFLKHIGKEKINTPIQNGDKIKYVYLKQNQYNLETVAFKNYDDPQELIDFVKQYADYAALFNRELAGKLEEFYSAMGWGMLPTAVNQDAFTFFEFN